MKPVQHRVIHGSRFLGDREKVGEQGVKVWGIEHHVTMTYETRGALPTISILPGGQFLSIGTEPMISSGLGSRSTPAISGVTSFVSCPTKATARTLVLQMVSEVQATVFIAKAVPAKRRAKVDPISNST